MVSKDPVAPCFLSPSPSPRAWDCCSSPVPVGARRAAPDREPVPRQTPCWWPLLLASPGANHDQVEVSGKRPSVQFCPADWAGVQKEHTQPPVPTVRTLPTWVCLSPNALAWSGGPRLETRPDPRGPSGKLRSWGWKMPWVRGRAVERDPDSQCWRPLPQEQGPPPRGRPPVLPAAPRARRQGQVETRTCCCHERPRPWST